MKTVYLQLTKKQQKAFESLRKSFERCKKEGLYLVSNYGNLEPYDSKIVIDYSDYNTYRKGDAMVYSSQDVQSIEKPIKYPMEWCDDEHLLKVTPKGDRIIKKLIKESA